MFGTFYTIDLHITASEGCIREQLQNTPHDKSMLENVSQRPTMWAPTE